MKTLLWLGGGFFVLCLAIGLYFMATVPRDRNLYAPDAIIAVQNRLNAEGDYIVLRKNRRYEQWIPDAKSGRVFLYTQKWATGNEGIAASLPGAARGDVVLYSPVNAARVRKLGRTDGAKAVNYASQPPEFFQPPTEADFQKIQSLRKRLKSHG